eukprot:UN08454
MQPLFKTIDKPNAEFQWGVAKAFYYDGQNEYCIIATHWNEHGNTPGLYQFDLKHNLLTLISTYPPDFKPSSPGIRIDQDNHKMYFCGQLISHFCVFDLKSKSWRNIRLPIMLRFINLWKKEYFWPCLHFIKPLQEVIIYRGDKPSYRFNTTRNKLIK